MYVISANKSTKEVDGSKAKAKEMTTDSKVTIITIYCWALTLITIRPQKSGERIRAI